MDLSNLERCIRAIEDTEAIMKFLRESLAREGGSVTVHHGQAGYHDQALKSPRTSDSRVT